MMGEDNELGLVCKARLHLGLSHVDVECSVDSYRQSLKTFLFSQY